MKKIITSVALALFTTAVMAQDYTIKTYVKVDGLPPEYAGFAEQDIVSYIKGEKYKREETSMMGSSTSAFDGKKLTVISEQMGEKSGYTATKEELDAAKKTEKEKEVKPKIEYLSDKKTIAGYECSKAVMTVTGKDKKEEQKITLWVTEKIKMPENKGGTGGRRSMSMDFGDLKGYPLEIEFATKGDGQEIKVVVTTSEVLTTNIEDAVFNVSTEGYKMSTYKEHQEKMKAMQGKAGN